MLGDALGLVKRDLYVDDDFAQFEIRNHPWYVGAVNLGLTPACVIKSHEFPASERINFAARRCYLVRDGRDVAVSKYFFDKEFCVNNGLTDGFHLSFDDHLYKVAREWRAHVRSWLSAGAAPHRYEDFHENPQASLAKLLGALKFQATPSRIEEAVTRHNKEKFRKSLDSVFEHNTFVRKAVVGDWRNHFDRRQIRLFKEVAGDALVELGYEPDLHW